MIVCATVSQSLRERRLEEVCGGCRPAVRRWFRDFLPTQPLHAACCRSPRIPECSRAAVEGYGRNVWRAAWEARLHSVLSAEEVGQCKLLAKNRLRDKIVGFPPLG